MRPCPKSVSPVNGFNRRTGAPPRVRPEGLPRFDAHLFEGHAIRTADPRNAPEGSALLRIPAIPTFPGDPIMSPSRMTAASSTPSRAELAAGDARLRSRHPELSPSRAVPTPRATLAGGRAAPAVRSGSRLHASAIRFGFRLAASPSRSLASRARRSRVQARFGS